tara:strand:- start:235 stop:450 length:216 start_codon:yes stop_codon:yes gene_type:complete
MGRAKSTRMSAMPDIVVVRPPKDADNEKPDDYDRVSRPLVVLKRMFLFFPRLFAGLLRGLWKRLFGSREKP